MDPSPEKKQTPYYDDIDQFDMQPKHLKQNVAYGPVSLSQLTKF